MGLVVSGENIKLFNLFSAKTLNLLYESFPVPKSFNFYEFLDSAKPLSSINAFYTIKWLEKERFLTYESINESGEVAKAILTHKGLELLKKDDIALELKTALKIGKEEIIKKIIDKLFSLI